MNELAVNQRSQVGAAVLSEDEQPISRIGLEQLLLGSPLIVVTCRTPSRIVSACVSFRPEEDAWTGYLRLVDVDPAQPIVLTLVSPADPTAPRSEIPIDDGPPVARLACPRDGVIAMLLGLLPPGSLGDSAIPERTTLPLITALAAITGYQQGSDETAHQVCTEAGFDEPPTILRCFATPLEVELTIVIGEPGRWWLDQAWRTRDHWIRLGPETTRAGIGNPDQAKLELVGCAQKQLPIPWTQALSSLRQTASPSIAPDHEEGDRA